MAINQRMLAEEMRRLQQQGMSLDRTPITMESQVNALANQPLAPGMVSAYVDESKPDPRAKSFTGEENRLKSQRAYADMLRGKEAPKGKTVGPFDLYMGPNWGESLAYAGEQALGGYMAGLANRDDKALDEEKGKVLAATLAAEDEENARKAAIEKAKLNLLESADAREAKPDRDYMEFTDGNSVLRGYVEDGVAFDEKGQPIPDGYSEIIKSTRSSGSQYQPITKADPYGNIILTSFNKADGSVSPPTFTDGTPYNLEEAERRGDESAEQAGKIEREKNKGKSLIEQYGDASAGLLANNAAIGQYKIALQAIKEGANTGFISDILPNIKAPTIKLYNARDSQALTQIASYTFGSLSEAEGNWLKSTSIPTNMDEDELTKWLNKKIEGFERASASERYRLDVLKENQQPDPKVLEEIKYGGGFVWE